MTKSPCNPPFSKRGTILATLLSKREFHPDFLNPSLEKRGRGDL
jgi:hypothetical protein